MKSKVLICAAMALLAGAMPVHLAAQETAKCHHHHKYHHYQLNNMGTFGGPDSNFDLSAAAACRSSRYEME